VTKGQGAEGDPGQDGGGANRLGGADRVAEHDRAGGGTDQRLQVHEGAGGLGRDPGLALGEQGVGAQGAQQGQAGGGHQGHPRAAGDRRRALGERGHRQGGHGRGQELHGRHGHRVAALEEARLGDRERGREPERRQDQAVAGPGGPAAPAGGDQGDPAERHREPAPRRRRPQPALAGGRHERHQHGRGPDEQGGVADAGPGDTGVLDKDRPAVAGRPPGRHGRAPGVAGPAPDGCQEHGRGQAEAGHGEPARRQPGQGELGHGHGRAPEQAGGGERGHGVPAVGVHGAMVAAGPRHIRQSRDCAKQSIVRWPLRLTILTSSC
jgi:hypothetical protein